MYAFVGVTSGAPTNQTGTAARRPTRASRSRSAQQPFPVEAELTGGFTQPHDHRAPSRTDSSAQRSREMIKPFRPMVGLDMSSGR
jgi:hypothetical protein